MNRLATPRSRATKPLRTLRRSRLQCGLSRPESRMLRSSPALAALLLVLTTASAWSNGLPAEAVEIRDALRRNDLDAAIEASESATGGSADARVWLWAGRAYGRQAIEASLFTQPKWAGRTRDAWEKAVALDPELLDARFDLIQYYLQAPG